MICPLHAWGDESVRSHGFDAPAYLLGASVVDTDDVPMTRAVLEGLRPTRGKLHWHDLDDRDRRRVLAAVGRLPAAHLIVVAHAIDPRREERARAICLGRLGWELGRHGVTALVLEARAAALTARDLRVVRALRGRRAIPADLRIDHGDPRTEPMLWLPDQVLGAVGWSARTGFPLGDALAASVETFDVRP